jgi:hypothetical protein
MRATRIVAAAVCSLLSLAGGAWSYQPSVNFQLNCMGCHLPDGSGQAGRVPSIRRSLVPFSATPLGRSYVLRVPGVAQSPLSDADTAALLNWMAHNLSDVAPPTGFVDYSEPEVRALRHHPLAQVRALRARLMRDAATSAATGATATAAVPAAAAAPAAAAVPAPAPAAAASAPRP